MGNHLNGKVAIVTGGASGLGLAFTEILAGEGAQVIVADLSEECGRSLAKQVSDRGGKCFFKQTDISKSSDVQAMINITIEKFSRLDILINNAGLQHVAPIHEFEEGRWDHLISVMLTGTFLCTKYSLPHMRACKQGRIINISSVLGHVGVKYKAAYVTAKHGILGFTKVVALEGAAHNITAVAVCPSFVRTPLMEKQIAAQAQNHDISEGEVINKIMLEPVPLRRMLEPREVAELILFLTSDAAQTITGSAVNIDCGWTSR